MIMVTTDTTRNIVLIPLISATDSGVFRHPVPQGMLIEFTL